MSAALKLHPHLAGDYTCLAQQYVAETADLVRRGDTIAQTPEALEVILDVADRAIRAGGNGWVFVFADGSALATSNVSDMIWPRWVA